MIRACLSLLVLLFGLAGLGAAQSPPFTQCSVQVGGSPTCAVLIVIQPNGSLKVLRDPSIQPYDGSDDTLVGVLNNSGSTVYGISLTGPDIFGFDGDGLCTYITCTWPAPTGYEGPNTSFVVTDTDHGIVNFFYADDTGGSGLDDGDSVWFSLEGAPSQVANLSSSVALDPGHGQTNCPLGRTGATGTVNYPTTNPPPGKLLEYKLTYAIALQLQAQFQTAGYAVTVTRNSLNECPSYKTRAMRANTNHANVFMSIHLDGAGPSAHGTQVFYTTDKQSSATLAQLTADHVSASLGTYDRGASVDPMGYAVLRLTDMTSALAEVAFLSNATDQDIIHNTGSITAAANGLFAGISAFINQNQ